ncbi:patatin-like phospholipase family protein [bacterium]|nr:patatin-like phospholipase family protein [candidate division CSSED10-310 bacterium]
MRKTITKDVSLVLGSGGARGLAHIGVIHYLEENGYKIRSISGASIGALVGGIYAAGKLDEFEQWVRAVTKVHIVTLLDISWGKSGLVKGDKIINNLIDLVGDQMIEDLPIQFTAVATDVLNHREIWIKSGKLFDAIRASISIPLLFTPFKHKGVDLIDGGVLNPVPVAPTIGDSFNMIVAVNLNGPPESQQVPSDTGVPAHDSHASPLYEKVNHYINRLQRSMTRNHDRDWGAYDIAIQSFEAMQGTIARQKLAAYPPDIVINIDRNACRTLEFDRASEMVDLGYRKAGDSFSQSKWQK